MNRPQQRKRISEINIACGRRVLSCFFSGIIILKFPQIHIVVFVCVILTVIMLAFPLFYSKLCDLKCVYIYVCIDSERIVQFLSCFF